MKNFTIASLPIYRLRYVLSYIAIGLLLAGLLVLAATYSPGGLSTDEQIKTVTVNKLELTNLTPATIIDLPHHLLQYASISLLGITQVSIKLPSLLLGAITAVALIFLLHRWFRSNVAILTALLVITTGQFLFISQSGTSAVLYLLWPSLILLFSTLIIQRAKLSMLWYSLLFAAITLSLYSPLSIYIIIALIIAAIAHPKLRLSLRTLPYGAIAAPLLLSSVLLLPLLTEIYQQPSIVLTLLGIPETLPNIGENALIVLRQYFDFVTPNSSDVLTPILGLGSLGLIALGLLTIFRSRYTIRSYTIISWLLLLLPIVVIHPPYLPVIFVPLMLVLAIGIDTLIREWYKLFPLNPYARFAGLLPIGLLIFTLMATGVERYVYGYHYDPEISQNFSRDTHYLHKATRELSGKATLLVAEEEREFYEAMASNKRTFDDLEVEVATTSEAPSTADPTAHTIYTHDAFRDITPQVQPSTIVVSAFSSDADRFYIYKSDQK